MKFFWFESPDAKRIGSDVRSNFGDFEGRYPELRARMPNGLGCLNGVTLEFCSGDSVRGMQGQFSCFWRGARRAYCEPGCQADCVASGVGFRVAIAFIPTRSTARRVGGFPRKPKVAQRFAMSVSFCPTTFWHEIGVFGDAVALVRSEVFCFIGSRFWIERWSVESRVPHRFVVPNMCLCFVTPVTLSTPTVFHYFPIC